MAKPIKFVKTSITNVSVAASMTVNGVANVPYRWNARLTVTSQAHSDSTTTPVANYYTGRNVAVGDWVVSDGDGKALKIYSITAGATDNVVNCVLEDAGNFNAIKDETQNLDGLIQNGAGITGYIFEVKNGVPLLSSIPNALPGNLAGTSFAANLQARFQSLTNVGVDSSTGKLPASLLPPASSTTPGAVMASGEMSIAADGTITLATITPTGTGAKPVVDAKGRVTGYAALAATDIPSLDWSKITGGKPTTLAGYGITDAMSASARGAVNGVAALGADGKIPTAQLPTIALATVHVVASQNAMLTLSAVTGDIAVRTDVNQTFILRGSNPAVLADWQELLTPTNAVQSVNGLTGAVTISTISGNAGTATALQTARAIAVSGDVTGTANFNGTANISIAATLANSGVAAGTYAKVTVDAKGRVTSGSAMVAADIPNLDWAKITSGKPTTLAGYGITDAAVSGHNHTLDGLSNVTATAKAANDVLQWNGTAWVNRSLVNAGIQPAGSYVAANAAIAPGSYEKVTVDAKGLVTSGGQLTSADLPDIDGGLF